MSTVTYLIDGMAVRELVFPLGCFVIGMLTGLVLSYLQAEHEARQASKQNQDDK